MRPFPVSHWGSRGFNGVQSLVLPLQDTLVPTLALGTSTPVFSVSGALGSVIDWEGMVRRTRAGEARFLGARRISNLIAGSSVNLTNASWTKDAGGAGSAAGVATANFATDPLGGSTASRLQLNMGSDAAAGYSRALQSYTAPTASVRVMAFSVWLKSNSGTPTVCIRNWQAGSTTAANVTLDSTWRRYSVNATTPSTTTLGVDVGLFGTNYGGSGNPSTADILVWGAQYEEVSGQSNQAPGDYVSVGVAASPYHGAGLDGVKYFSTKNGNSVASNIVTEAVGAAITTANGGSALSVDSRGPLGFMEEYGSSNGVNWGSEDLSNWTTLQGSTSPAANGIAAPTGYITRNAILENGASSLHGVDQNLSMLSSASMCCYSIFFKPGIRDSILIRLHDGTHGVMLDLRDLTTTPIIFAYTEIGTAFTLGSSGLISFPNGWYRVWGTFTKNGSTTFAWQNWLKESNTGSVTYTGTNGAVGIYLWGAYIAQLMPASYLPTWSPDGSGRAAEALDYTFASNANATVGTAKAEVTTFHSAGMSYNAPLVAFGTNPSFPLYNANTVTTTINANDGTNATQKTGLPDMFTGVRKVACSWTGSTMLVTGNGQAPQSGTFDGNMGSTKISIGGATTFTGNVWNGSIRNVTIYTTAANAGELQFVTT